MGSSIPGARAALFALLQAASVEVGNALKDVQMSWGPPGTAEEQEVVAMLGVTNSSDDDATLGTRSQEEHYELELKVKVHNPAAAAPTDVETRAWALIDALRALVRANATLTQTVRLAKLVSTTTDGALPAEGGGWVIFVTPKIACVQRIT